MEPQTRGGGRKSNQVHRFCWPVICSGRISVTNGERNPNRQSTGGETQCRLCVGLFPCLTNSLARVLTMLCILPRASGARTEMPLMGEPFEFNTPSFGADRETQISFRSHPYCLCVISSGPI